MLSGSLDAAVGDAQFVEMRCGGLDIGLDIGLGVDVEGKVVEADAVLVEAVVGHRPKPDQRVADVVDHTAEQEPGRVA